MRTASKKTANKSASKKKAAKKSAKSSVAAKSAGKRAAKTKHSSRISGATKKRDAKLPTAPRGRYIELRQGEPFTAGFPNVQVGIKSAKPDTPRLIPKSKKFLAATTGRIVKSSPVTSRLSEKRIEAAVKAVVGSRYGRD